MGFDRCRLSTPINLHALGRPQWHMYLYMLTSVLSVINKINEFLFTNTGTVRLI